LKTLAANSGVIIWITLLIFAPALAWAQYRRCSAMILAGGGAATMVVVSAVAYSASLLGVGTIVPLRCCAVVLGILLFWVGLKSTRLLRDRTTITHFASDSLAIPLGVALGIWVIVPPLLALHKQGLTFGLVTLYNADLAQYVLAAENTAVAGFHNSNHVANLDLGTWSHEKSYMGATALINFGSAATGLPAIQVTFAMMGVAVCMLAVALWALGRTIWPTAHYSVALAVVIACLAALSTYTYGQFFLASVLGLASVATSLAGATLLARDPGRQGILGVAAGGALGVYCYGHLGLPVLCLLPVWTVVAASAVPSGARSRGTPIAAAARPAAAVVVALALSSIQLPEALDLVRSQSQIQAGWSLPRFFSQTALVWPSGIERCAVTCANPSLPVVLVSWFVVLLALTLALVAAWHRALRQPVMLATALTLACLFVVTVAIEWYGPDRYQTWKLEAFLLPLVTVIALPAMGASAVGPARLSRSVLTTSVGIVILCPFILWTPSLNTVRPDLITTQSLMKLPSAPALSDVESLNIRLPDYFQTMSVGAAITNSTVIFTQNSYSPNLVSLRTCTLTRLEMLSPGERHFTDLGGGYVLLNRPSVCARRK
jgi:hypothetical protein